MPHLILHFAILTSLFINMVEYYVKMYYNKLYTCLKLEPTETNLTVSAPNPTATGEQLLPVKGGLLPQPNLETCLSRSWVSHNLN